MANVQGFITGAVYGGPDNPAVNVARCTLSGIALPNATVVQFGDTLAFGGNFQQYIPQGTVLLDAILRIFDASSTLSVQVGYAAADGSTGTTNGVADVNATYFLSTTSIAASGITRATGPVTVVRLQRPTVITMTVVTGAVGSEAVFEIDVFYRYTGNEGANSVEVA